MDVAELGPLTRDAICRGLLHLWQPRKGYRFNLDSVLLAAWCAEQSPRGPVVDAGAGCGVVGLYLARAAGLPVVLVERQGAVAALGQRNLVGNDAAGHVVRGDFRALPLADRSVGTVVCNPPYAAPGAGKVSPLLHKRLSREAVHGGAPDVLAECERVLDARGRLFMTVPAETALALRSSVLHRQRVVWLTARPGAQVDRALVLFGREGLEPAQEWRAVHEGSGAFAPWVLRVLEPGAAP